MSHPSETFMTDLRLKQSMPRGLLCAARVHVEMAVVAPREVVLRKIKAERRGNGDGSGALSKIVQMADRHGVDVSLIAVPDYDLPGPTDGAALARLVRFYGRFGFVPSDGDVTAPSASLVRPSASTCILDRPEFRLLSEELLPSGDDRAAAVAAHLADIFGQDDLDAALELAAAPAPPRL
jgi:hypothetical protein